MPKRDRNLVNIPPLESHRKELRKNPTPAEAILWNHLRGRKVLGQKFRRQYSIGRYIVDFFCPDCDLAIELDGAPHYDLIREDYETHRTAFLEASGVRILRFENRVIYENLEAVLEIIRAAIKGGVTDLPRPR